jgi:hypothetical protein
MPADHTSFIRYLEAKKPIDDRSLNAHVAQTLIKTLNELFSDVEIYALEAGCGIGSMIERMISWDALTKASYMALDIEPEYVAEAMDRLVRYGMKTGMEVHKESRNNLVLHSHGQHMSIKFRTGDVINFARKKTSLPVYHLTIAHAFLDLVDIYNSLPPILSRVIPGGLVYFTLNYDGVTSLEPPIEADLDRQIISLYHETMDRRRVSGRPSGDSMTGRHLLPFLQNSGLNILDAGASDWVVFPTNGSYQDDDAYFLHFIVDTIYRATQFHPETNPGQLHSWTAARHRQIEGGQLFFVAHQLDVLAQMPSQHGNT